MGILHTAIRSLAGFQHFPDDTHQGSIFQGSSHSLFVRQLLVNLLCGAVRSFLDAHIDTESRRKRLFQANPYSKPDNCG